MELIAISLILFSNLFISITDAEKPLRRFNSGHSDSEDCVCFPGGQSLIPELVTPELYGLERLVVYLYRVVDTNQIILHKPGPEKQVLVPNVPFTEGDIIKLVTADTIASLFSNYPHDGVDGMPQDHADPIGLNIDTIHNVGPKLNPNEFSPISSKPNEVLHPSIPSFMWKYLDQSQQPSPPYQTNKSSIYPRSYKHPNVFQNNGHLEPNYVEINNPFQPNPIHLNPKIVETIITNTPKIWETNDKKLFVPVSPFQPNPVAQLQIQPDVVKILKDNEGEQRWPKPNLTFDNWFNKQIKLLHNPQLIQDVRAIGNNGLRKLLLEILFENGIHIGATGFMINEKGTSMNLEHLELRPILVGDPVKLQTLQGHQQLTFPQRKPYFEGLLITIDNPFKILGVIPLGKTYLSSQKQITQVPINPGIQHYLTPSSQPEAVESAKSWQFGKFSTSLKIPGLLKTKTSLGLPVPKLLRKFINSKTSVTSFESNPDFQSRNAHKRLEYNNNYNAPSSSSVLNYYHQSAENSLNPKPHDIAPLQLIQNPINVNGAHAGITGPQLTVTEITGESDHHLTVTPIDSSVESSQLMVTEFAGKPNPHLSTIPLDGNLVMYPHHGVDSSSPQLIVTELTDKLNPHLITVPVDGNSETLPYHSADSSSPQLILTELRSSPQLIVSELTDKLNPHIITIPLNGNSETNPYHGVDSSTPHLTVTELNNKPNPHLIIIPLDGNSETYSHTHGADNSNPQLTVTEITRKPDYHLTVVPLDSNPLTYLNPKLNVKPINNRPPFSLNQLLEPHSFSPKLIAQPPDDEISSWTSKRMNEETTEQPTAPKLTPQETISNFGDSQSQNEAVSDFVDLNDDLTKQVSKPFQDVFKEFIQMVLHNLIKEGSEDNVEDEDEGKGSDVSIEVNSTNQNEKSGLAEDFDGPDFRIIGGSAATGSGAPLSNKGRNGLRFI